MSKNQNFKRICENVLLGEYDEMDNVCRNMQNDPRESEEAGEPEPENIE